MENKTFVFFIHTNILQREENGGKGEIVGKWETTRGGFMARCHARHSFAVVVVWHGMRDDHNESMPYNVSLYKHITHVRLYESYLSLFKNFSSS